MSEHEAERLRELLHACAPEAPGRDDLAGRARARAHRMRRNRRAGVAGLTVVAMAAIGVPVGLHLAPSDTSDSPRIAGPGPVRKCHVTQPLPQKKVPEMLSFLGGDWYGADNLWVRLPESTISPESAKLEFDTMTLHEKGRTPTLTAERLDGEGHATGSQRAAGPDGAVEAPSGQGFHPWWSAITLPAAGCWQLTSTLGDTTVTFVLDVGRLQREAAAWPIPPLLARQQPADELPRAVRTNRGDLVQDTSRLLGRSRYGRHWVVNNMDGGVCLVTQLRAGQHEGPGTTATTCATPQRFERNGVSLTVQGRSGDGAVAHLLPPRTKKSVAQKAVDRLNRDPEAKAQLLDRDSTLLIVHAVGADKPGINDQSP